MKPAPHSPHFVRPENRYFGWRNWLKCLPSSPDPHLCCTLAFRAWTPFQSSSSMMRSSETSFVIHSDGDSSARFVYR